MPQEGLHESSLICVAHVQDERGFCYTITLEHTANFYILKTLCIFTVIIGVHRFIYYKS